MKAILGIMLLGAVTAACLSSEDVQAPPTNVDAIDVPPELNLTVTPSKCVCETSFDCRLLCGANLICAASSSGGDHVCITAQALKLSGMTQLPDR